MKRGGPVGRLFKTVDEFPAELSEEVTALGLVTWLARGKDPARDPVLVKGIGCVMQILPEWRAGGVDYLYWTFGTLLMKQLGGYQERAWNAALDRALSPRFRTEGGECWPAEDAWCLPTMQVYPTAMCLWALSVAHGR